MPGSFRAAVILDAVKQLPTLLAEFWLRLRVRWRHNPGFLAAAAAGSIGLMLALGLVFQGGIRLLSGKPAVDEVEEDSAAIVLAAADDDEQGSGVADPFSGQSATLRPAARRTRFEDADDSEADERARFRQTVRNSRIAALEERDAEADDDDAAPAHSLSEHPLADDQETPRRVILDPVKKAVKIDDEADWGDAADESVEIATQAPAQKPERLKSDIGPLFGDDQTEEADDTEVDKSADSVQPVADTAKTPTTGWKHQAPTALPDGDASPALAEQSRAVETVIYAAPKSAADSARSTRPNDEYERPRLAVTILGPKAVGVGQKCNFEVHVKNNGAVPAKKLTLSVELPAGLVHEVAQTLEQRVEGLAAGATYRALLRLRAQAPGKLNLQADIAAEGRVAAQTSTVVDIKEAASPAAKRDLPNCADLPEMRQGGSR